MRAAPRQPGEAQRKIDVVDPAEITLRSYWFSRRKPAIQFEVDAIELRLPVYFGKQVWSIPIDQVGVIDLVRRDSAVEVVTDEGGVVFASPLAIPYFVTTGPLAKPNLVLLFRSKRRLPPFRRYPNNKGQTVPFTAKMTRSAEGAWVSRLTLRAQDSTNAQQTMERAGVVTVPSMLEWLKERYETINDPEEKAKHFERGAQARRVNLILRVLFLALSGGLWLSFLMHNGWFVLGLLIPWSVLLAGSQHILRLLSNRRSG